MAIHPGMVEELAAGTRDLYEQAEQRLLGIIARQLADGLDAPGWVERKLSAVQAVRRASQAVVGELGKATTLEVFDVVAEAYNTGHRAAVAEVGALSDDARRLVDDVTPNAQAVDRLAQETVDRITATHRSILRAVDDRYRGIVAEVTATPLLGTGTRRQATQDAMRRFADEGIRTFTDRAWPQLAAHLVRGNGGAHQRRARRHRSPHAHPGHGRSAVRRGVQRTARVPAVPPVGRQGIGDRRRRGSPHRRGRARHRGRAHGPRQGRRIARRGPPRRIPAPQLSPQRQCLHTGAHPHRGRRERPRRIRGRAATARH